MARGISEFKTKLINGGARPNLFLVRLNFPTTLGQIADIGPIDASTAITERAEFLVKTAQLPASTIGTIDVPFRGRIDGARNLVKIGWNRSDFIFCDCRGAFAARPDVIISLTSCIEGLECRCELFDNW